MHGRQHEVAGFGGGQRGGNGPRDPAFLPPRSQSGSCRNNVQPAARFERAHVAEHFLPGPRSPAYFSCTNSIGFLDGHDLASGPLAVDQVHHGNSAWGPFFFFFFFFSRARFGPVISTKPFRPAASSSSILGGNPQFLAAGNVGRRKTGKLISGIAVCGDKKVARTRPPAALCSKRKLQSSHSCFEFLFFAARFNRLSPQSSATSRLREGVPGPAMIISPLNAKGRGNARRPGEGRMPQNPVRTSRKAGRNF